MNVLYLNTANNTFNHVLAIFTRTSEPAKLETDASAFVGSGLVLREYLGVPLTVPSSLIGVFSVPYESSDLSQPRNLYAASATGQSGLSQLVSFSNAAPTLTFAKPALTIPYTGAAPTPALILLQGPSVSTPQLQQATISAAAQSVDLTGLMPSTTYYCLVFVPTYPITGIKFST